MQDLATYTFGNKSYLRYLNCMVCSQISHCSLERHGSLEEQSIEDEYSCTHDKVVSCAVFLFVPTCGILAVVVNVLSCIHILLISDNRLAYKSAHTACEGILVEYFSGQVSHSHVEIIHKSSQEDDGNDKKLHDFSPTPLKAQSTTFS